jgi:hypothetical protein
MKSETSSMIISVAIWLIFIILPGGFFIFIKATDYWETRKFERLEQRVDTELLQKAINAIKENNASVKWRKDFLAERQKQNEQDYWLDPKRTFTWDEAKVAFSEDGPYFVYGNLEQPREVFEPSNQSPHIEVELNNLYNMYEFFEGPQIVFRSRCDSQKIQQLYSEIRFYGGTKKERNIYPWDGPVIAIIGDVLRVDMVEESTYISEQVRSTGEERSNTYLRSEGGGDELTYALVEVTCDQLYLVPSTDGTLQFFMSTILEL